MNSETKKTESQRIVTRLNASQKRRYAKGVGFLLVAVAAGIVIGVGGSIVYFKNAYHRVPPTPEAIAQAMLEHMHRLLNLKPEEESKITEIIYRHLDEVDTLRDESRENTREVFQRMNGEIETVVGSDRYKIWDEFKQKNWHSKKRGSKNKPRGDRKAQDDKPLR